MLAALNVSSEFDSDFDSEPERTNRPELKLQRKTLQVENPVRKKDDICSTKVQEGVLTETSISCDVGEFARTRKAKIIKAYKKELEHRKNEKLRLAKQNDSDKDEVKGTSRSISSESDSDFESQPKRTKRLELEPKRKTLQVQNPARKKYDICSTKSCDVREFNRTRKAKIMEACRKELKFRKNEKLRLAKLYASDKDELKETL